MRRRDSHASPNDSSVQHLYHLLFRVQLLQHTQAVFKYFCNDAVKVVHEVTETKAQILELRRLHTGIIYLGAIFGQTGSTWLAIFI